MRRNRLPRWSDGKQQARNLVSAWYRGARYEALRQALIAELPLPNESSPRHQRRVGRRTTKPAYHTETLAAALDRAYGQVMLTFEGDHHDLHRKEVAKLVINDAVNRLGALGGDAAAESHVP